MYEMYSTYVVRLRASTNKDTVQERWSVRNFRNPSAAKHMTRYFSRSIGGFTRTSKNWTLPLMCSSLLLYWSSWSILLPFGLPHSASPNDRAFLEHGTNAHQGAPLPYGVNNRHRVGSYPRIDKIHKRPVRKIALKTKALRPGKPVENVLHGSASPYNRGAFFP